MITFPLACPKGDPWDEAGEILQQLIDHGHEAYFVGGCIRDLLMEKEVSDVDIATSAHPEQVEKIFSKTVAVGKKFGVMIVVCPSGANVEVATFRSDGTYIDGRRPEKVIFASVEEDMSRRDFTINALFFSPEKGQVFDYVGGLQDINDRCLRAVGDASARMQEDRLRIFRGLRFMAALELNADEKTWEAFCKIPAQELSSERIIQEWFKGMKGSHCGRWLQLLFVSGRLADMCLPLAKEKTLVEETIRRLEKIREGSRAEKAAVWLSGLLPTTALAWVAVQPLTRDLITQLRWLLDQHWSVSEIARWPVSAQRRLAMHPWVHELKAIERACAPNAAATRLLEAVLAQEYSGQHYFPLITSADLSSRGVRPGPNFGKILRACEDAQLQGVFITREAALQSLDKYVAEAKF